MVVQQLVSNLASAIFIPFFQDAKDFAKEGDGFERPQYTFSFVVLMVTHVVATLYFATFNGDYKRLEHEQLKKKEYSEKKRRKSGTEQDANHDKTYVDEEQQI